MNDMKSLDQLSRVADEMLGGLHADERMRLAIKRVATERGPVKKTSMLRLAPALCCAALALACVGVTATRLNRPEQPAALVRSMPPSAADTVEIETIAAGETYAPDTALKMAGLGDNVMVRVGSAGAETLFADGEGDIPLVTVDGAVYQMLKTPKDVGAGMLGSQVGSVQQVSDQPSLASGEALRAGLSNVAQEGTAVYAVRGLPQTTAVAAEVDGSMRIFQRVSYAGRGPAGSSLEETFSVRGKVKQLELSGVGKLTGEAANRAIDVLLDQAVLQSSDASSRRQTLTVTLDSGLKLQLGVSGDTLCGCGGWNCPAFFEAFEAAL